MACNQTKSARFAELLCRGVLVAVLSVAAGCSRPPSKVNVPLSEIAAAYAEAACGAVTDCNAATASALFGANDCASRFTGMLLNGALVNVDVAVTAGTIVYDSSALAGCTSAMRALGCTYFGALGFRDLVQPPECEAVLRGMRAEGESCSITLECAGDLYCKTVGATCPGTCSQRGIAGAACEVNANCAQGLFCRGGTCTAKVAAGEECGADLPARCVDEAYCWGASSTVRGDCLTYDALFSRLVGDDCFPVLSPLCGAGLTCGYDAVATKFTCMEPAPSDGACPWALPDACQPSQYCKGLISGDLVTQGVCTLLPVEGEDCVTALSFGKRCAQDHVCISSKCVKLKANGESCSAPEACFSGSCPTGTCAPPEVCEIGAE